MNTAPIQPNPTQPDSNERDELARLLPKLVERDLPSGRQRQLQEFVMSQIHQDPGPAERVPRRAPRRRFVLATSVLAAAAVAAVAIGTGGFGGFGAGRAPDGSSVLSVQTRPETELASVAQTFELAAAYAAATPFTPPRPHQWIYIKSRNFAPGGLAKAKGQDPDVTYQVWTRADGKKMAGYNSASGRLETWEQDTEYPWLCALPTEPRALLAKLRAHLEQPFNVRGQQGQPQAPRAIIASTPEEWNNVLFRRIAQILSHNLLPSDVTAALWRAAALIPGVTRSPGTIEIGGRQVIAVGRVQDGSELEQLLLDSNTHEFVGYRSVAVKDFTVEGGSRPVKVKKGEVQFAFTWLAAKIVNAAGQTG